MKPIIAITIGDFNGIGPEIALKAVLNPSVKKICIPVLIGPIRIFEQSSKQFKLNASFSKATVPILKYKGVPVIDVGDGIESDVQYGIPSKSSGRTAGAAIERAVEFCLQKKVDAMVTSPISKEALNNAGYNFPGQTEMIALLSHSQRVAMVLISTAMKVGLVTIHTGLGKIAEQISKEKVIEKISIINESLKIDFRKKEPRLAVLGLNPHSGENGLIGTEENKIIIPAVNECRSSGVQVEGPFPADAFFGKHEYKKFDSVIAMYHDQGLIPLKMSSFGKAVNFSAGLKIVRTSPDHGTAYDIAGKNKANLSSILEAIKLAVQISKNRANHD